MVTDSSLHGRVVVSSDGLVVGEINRLIVEPDDWHVAALEVKLRKEAADRAGIERGLFRAATVEISTAAVQSTGDAVILTVPISGLRQAVTPAAEAQPRAPTTPTTPTPSPT